MTRPVKILVLIAIVFSLVVGSAALAVQVAVVRDGVISVHVVEKHPGGSRIHLFVPASMIRVGAGAVSIAMPEYERERLRDELEPWRPAIEAALRNLGEIDDVTFVQVETGDEIVEIRKKGEAIVIDAVTHDADVHVSVPLASVQTAIDALAY